MKIAIMQPYFFPYIGYFQLINAVDKFVIYDNVNFIKKGWINRNRILLNNADFLFTLPLVKISQNKLICETEISDLNKFSTDFLTLLFQAYKNAPYYNEVIKIIKEILNYNTVKISDLIYYSFFIIFEHLNIQKEIIIASKKYNNNNNNLKGEHKILDICKIENADTYINAIGGQELYDNDFFQKQNIDLFFIKTNDVNYKQFNNVFIPNLSIIDVLMFNSKEEIKILLNKYQLI